MIKKSLLPEHFEQYNARHALFTRDDKILLTVSGGVDSMVLMSLTAAAGYRFGVAHCNFQLRGKESEEDEQLEVSILKSVDDEDGEPMLCATMKTGVFGKCFSIHPTTPLMSSVIALLPPWYVYPLSSSVLMLSPCPRMSKPMQA